MDSIATCNLLSSNRLHDTKSAAGFHEQCVIVGTKFLEFDSVFESFPVTNHNAALNRAIGVWKGHGEIDRLADQEFMGKMNGEAATSDIAAATEAVGRQSTSGRHLNLDGDIDAIARKFPALRILRVLRRSRLFCHTFNLTHAGFTKRAFRRYVAGLRCQLDLLRFSQMAWCALRLSSANRTAV